MSGPARVVLGLAPPEEEAIDEALYGSGALRVLGSGADAGEVVELASQGAAELVLVSAGLPGLDPRSVARLRALGPRLAGLALDERSAALLEQLDLDLVVRPPLDPSRLLALLAAEPEPPTPGPAAFEPVPFEPVSFEPARLEPAPFDSAPPEPSALEGPAARAGAGSVLAVLGAKGAPGASEFAASFAALVGRAHDVLLVELDGEGGGLARRLGADPDERSLLGLARALAGQESEARELLPHWLSGGARGWPAVLVGPSDPGALLLADGGPSGPVARLLEALGAAFPLLVCDVGHRLAPRGASDLAVRLHREVALAADAVVLVLGARPEQLHAGFAQLDLLLGSLAVAPAAIRVVVNGQPGLVDPSAGPLGTTIAGELAARGLVADGWLPHDARALRAALRRGTPLAAAAPRGPYARAVSALAAAILLPALPRPAARKRRLELRRDGAQGRGEEEVFLPWRR